MAARSRMVWMAIAVVLVAAACSSASGKKTEPTTTTTTAPLPKASADPVSSSELGVKTSTEERCDPMSAQCMLPLPNDHFTVPDPSTPTQLRLALSPLSLPANVGGKHIDPTDENRADGWSPGSTILAQFPNLDAARSKLPGIADPRASLAPDSPIVLLDTTAGERHPFWAELDVNADKGAVPLLMIHPAVNFPDGHHIVVAIRGLVDTHGKAIAPSPAFAAYRDGQRTTDSIFERRRKHMEENFADLAHAGIARADLQLAWDFTVASTQSLTGRMIAIRDDAFSQLGSDAPTFTVTKVTANPNEFVTRRVEGTFEVPLYLTDGGKPGGHFVLDGDGIPQRQSGTFTAPFLCNLPPKSTSTPARMAIYGHGLLGDLTEASGSLTKKMGAENNVAYCATNFIGMAEEDVPNAVKTLQDLSNFPTMADRMQQGLLDNLFLGRLMKDAKGFSANAAFRFSGKSALDTDALYYDGNSQGAILGGALTAVAQDFTRATLAEAGMNYSVLLDRSVDFDSYLAIMKPAYPKRYDRVIGLEIVQLLWDRGETDGYANHVTSDPLPKTPEHTVLLLGAVGDHQVTEYSLRVEAATMGAKVHTPFAADGRTTGDAASWRLAPISPYPYRGSAYFLWDTGSPRSPVTNTPARKGHDPHDDTPNIPAVRKLKSEFWQPDGVVTDVCNGAPCRASVPPENAD